MDLIWKLCNTIWLKKWTGVDTSKFAKEADLASLKSDSDALDIDKLKVVSVDKYKLSNVVEKGVVKKTVWWIS